VSPEARDLASELVSGLRVPGLIAAGLTALIAAGGTLAVALLVSVLFPDNSLVGLVGIDSGIPVEMFRHVVQFLQVGVLATGGDAAERAAPVLFLIVPMGLCALVASFQASRTRGRPDWERLLWGAATALPFAFLMLFAALAGDGDGGVQPSAASAFVAGFFWAALGGAAGAGLALRRDRGAGGSPPARRPAVQAVIDVVVRGLQPLAILLLVCAVIGSVAWIVQSVLEPSEATGDRPQAIAIVENELYAVEHGVHLAELGVFAQFEGPRSYQALGLPLPASSPTQVASPLESYRVFAYQDGLAPYLFIPLLVVSIALPMLFALYAGFSVARARRAPSPLVGAGWGALVGPLWAFAMLAVDALVAKDAFGLAVPDSVFGGFLLVGSLLGALGGLLAAGRGAEPAAPGS